MTLFDLISNLFSCRLFFFSSGTTKQGFFSNDNIKNGCIKWKDPLSKIDKPFPLNLSKSNGNIALGHSKPDSSHFSQKQMSNGISVGYNLQRTKSIGDVLSVSKYFCG